MSERMYTEDEARALAVEAAQAVETRTFPGRMHNCA